MGQSAHIALGPHAAAGLPEGDVGHAFGNSRLQINQGCGSGRWCLALLQRQQCIGLGIKPERTGIHRWPFLANVAGVGITAEERPQVVFGVEKVW